MFFILFQFINSFFLLPIKFIFLFIFLAAFHVIFTFFELYGFFQ